MRHTFVLAIMFGLFWPWAGHAQEKDPNLLFKEASETYAQALTASETERRDLLREVGVLLEVIRTQHPKSIPARFMAEGRPLGGIDLEIVARATEPSPLDDLPGTLVQGIATTAIRVCTSAECVDAIKTGLSQFFAEAVYTNWDRAIDVEKVKWLFANPGQFDDSLERITVFSEMMDDPEILSDLNDRVGRALLEDMAKEAAQEIGVSLLTNLGTEVLASHLEASGRSSEADQLRRWSEPAVEIAQTLVTSGSATVASAGAGATVIWAKNAHALVALGQKQLQAEAAGATKSEQLAKLASDIDSLQRTLISGKTTGPLFANDTGIPVTPKMATTFESTLQSSYALQTYWLSSDDVLLLELFEPIMQIAKESARLANALSDEDETGQRTPALPADLAGAQVAPDGFLGPDVAVVGAEPRVTGDWRISGEGGYLDVDVAVSGVTLRSDNSVWAFGQQVLRPLNPGERSSAYVRSSADDAYRVVTQEVPNPQGWVPRLALIPRESTRPVISLESGDVFRFSGAVAWLDGGEFALVDYNFGEFESYALLVDLRDGRQGPIRSRRNNAQLSRADIGSVRRVNGTTHEISFQHLACPAGEPNCGMATIEDAGVEWIQFQLPSENETPAPERPSEPIEQKKPTPAMWTKAIVLDPAAFTLKCLWETDLACLEQEGASPDALRFARARAIEGGEGPAIATGFKETGRVDVAYLNMFNAAGTELPYFVNTSPETILLPSYAEKNLNLLASRGDRTAKSFLRQYPEAANFSLHVGGMRKLPNGYQRFSTIVPWTQMCRACPLVGMHVATVDFNPNGAFRAYEVKGILDARPLGGKFRYSVEDVRNHPSLVQYFLNIRGYDAGPMDGRLGPRSRQAIAAFQKENGVNSGTGQLDNATFAALAEHRTLFTNGTNPAAIIASPNAAPVSQKWLQVASRDTLFAAEQIAAQIAPSNPDVAIFQSDNGWFAVVAGLVPESLSTNLSRLVVARSLPADSFLTQGSSYVRNMGYQPPSMAPEHVCARADASLSASEILSLFEASTLDTREGAGRYVVRSYGNYDRSKDKGSSSVTTEYNGSMQTFDAEYRVSHGQICQRFKDQSRWSCEYVKRCDPDGKGEGKRLVLLTDKDQISVTFSFHDGRPTNGNEAETPAALYQRIDGDELARTLIAATTWKNSEDERGLLQELVVLSGSDFRQLSDLDKLSRLSGILNAIEKRANVPTGTFEKLNLVRNIRGGEHPTRSAVLKDPAWRLNENNAFHIIGIDNPNRVEKYTRSDGAEAVFFNHPQNGWEIMRDGENNATYNFVPDVPLLSMGFTNDNYQHLVLDIIPWIIWGATPADETTISKRLALFENTAIYKYLAQTVLPAFSGKLPDLERITTVDNSALLDLRKASAPELAALIVAFGVKPDNVGFVDGNSANLQVEMQRLIDTYQSNPPLVMTPNLPLSGGYDAENGVLSACMPRDVLFPSDVVRGAPGYGGAFNAAALVIAPSDPITGLGSLPALCAVKMGATRKVEAIHGKGELERFGLTNPRGLFVRFRMSAAQAAVFTAALQSGSARIEVRCEMKTMIRQPYVAIPYDYDKFGTCVPKTMTLKAIDFVTGSTQMIEYSAGGAVFNAKSGIITSTVPLPDPIPEQDGLITARAQWSFETNVSGESAVREIVEGFEGTPAEILLGYENAYPFQSDPKKKLAIKVFGALPENEVGRRAGTRNGYGSFVLKSWSDLNNYYYIDDPKTGIANAVVGTIDSLRILSVRELAAGSCEWSVTYRVWLRDETPFGTALAASNEGDGYTFESCFRTTRDGYDVESYRFLDG